jgi:hypothetical protein
MRRRLHGCLVVLLAAACGSACASPGSGDDGTGPITGADASIDTAGGADVLIGPSPDAVVPGLDSGGGSDASEAAADEAGDPADAEDDGHPSKSCVGLMDGTPCGASPDICHDAPLCEGGACAPPAPKADGFVCAAAPDDCHTAGTCKAGVCGAPPTRADGYEWTAGDTTARCCGGKPIHTDVDTDCGACGIQCNASNGESCQSFGGQWFCRGCVASGACWSHCCSESFSPYSCAASDCAGNCSDQYCPTGTHCVVGTVTSDYCSY